MARRAEARGGGGRRPLRPSHPWAA